MSTTNEGARKESSGYSHNDIYMGVSAGISAILFLTSFILTSKFLGGKEDWNTIRREAMTKIWPLSILGTIFLFIASAIYMTQDPHRTMYYLLALCCLTLGISYSALAISVISK